MSKLINESENNTKTDEFLNNDSIHYYEKDSNTNINKNDNISMIPNFLNTKRCIKNSNFNHSFNNEEDTYDLSEKKTENDFFDKNRPKKYMSTQKSSLPPSPMKRVSRFLIKEEQPTNWSDIKDFFFMKLPTLCYKMNFVYEEEKNYNKSNDLYLYLKDNYTIYDSEIIKQYFNEINNIFQGIYSCSGKIEQTLLHCLFYQFIIYFFIERNKNESQSINKKIKEIYSKGSYLLSFNDLAIINLFQGLNCDSYIDCEEPFSKSVMLFLIQYGDPRGKNNDSNAIMQLPLYKILRKTLKMLKDRLEINQYFYEIYKSLEYFEKNKTILNDNNTTYFDFERNIMDNLKNILKINDIYVNKKQRENILKNNSNNYEFLSNDYINKDLFISQKVFTNEMLNKYKIPNNQFLSIDEISDNINNIICSKDFIIYFLKQIQIVLTCKYILYDENYINTMISENVFNKKDEEDKKSSFYNDKNQINNKKNNNNNNIKPKEESPKENEKEFSPSQLIKAFKQGKNILSNFLGNEEKPSININRKNKLDISTNSKKINLNSIDEEIFSKSKRESKVNNNHSTEKYNQRSDLFSHFLHKELLQKLSYRSNCPSGIVVAFGNNSHNETAHDDFKIIKCPLLVYKLKNVRVKKVYSGWEHNIIISDTNEIYSFGHNNNCQCGIPINKNKNIDNIKIKNPINISDLNSGITAISAACGNEHTLILDNKNNVYSFGNNEDGVLGIKDSKIKSYQFNKVNFGVYNNRIKAIAAGTVHSIALTDDGKIFSWGSAQGGQLGLSEKFLTHLNHKNFYVQTPTLVPMNKSNDMKIIKISCGEAHTIVLNDKNEVYSWGFGSNGQLGLGFCEDSFELGTGLSNSRIFTPKKIESFEKDVSIKDVQCGKTFSMFIDKFGALYSCGVNDLNQLGIPEPPPQNHVRNYDSQCKDYVLPTKLIYFNNLKVEKISCGEAHCLAIIKGSQNTDKSIWSWGNNRYGQLGLGDGIKCKCSLPKPIIYLLEYKDNEYKSVSCGGFHSLCLINSKEDINWIKDDFQNIICKIINDIGII